jgi:hypothetical protein
MSNRMGPVGVWAKAHEKLRGVVRALSSQHLYRKMLFEMGADPVEQVFELVPIAA